MKSQGKKQSPRPIANKILIADDDVFAMSHFELALEREGFEVHNAPTLSSAKEYIERELPSVVVIDVMMPRGEGESELKTQGGFTSGVVLAQWLAKNYPQIGFVGLSGAGSTEVVEIFDRLGSAFFHKPLLDYDSLIEHIKRISKQGSTLPSRQKRHPKSFIVHGHDEKTKLQLKNYLQNTLGLPEPIILHEQPSLGRTIIEKFEHAVKEVELVFVVLTPDDLVADSGAPNVQKRRARQNVIFEMGYFFAKFQRLRGRVILLHSGHLELPSDISGMVYIDISDGIENSGEVIRRELSDFL